MRYVTPIMYLAITVLCGSVLLPSVSAQDELKARVRELAQPYIDSGTVVGMSIGVIKDGKSTTVNLGAVSKGGPATTEMTVYEIGSISKVFTGILLADAIATKKVTLGQSAQSLLPDGVLMPNWEDQEITLLNLSTHKSGLPRLPDNMPNLTSKDPYAGYTSKLAHEFLGSYKLKRMPGRTTEYSNFGVSLLGHLISSNSGKSYDELLQERIRRPLKMEDTRVALSDSMKARLATPYAASGEQDHNWDFADMPGAGGIRSTVSDLLLFAQANIESPGGEIGDALEIAWEKHTDDWPGMGLGWNLAKDGGTRWHNGQTGGYYGMMLINRKLGVAAIVLCNASSTQVDPLGPKIIQMLVGQPVKPRKFEKEIDVPVEVMQGYVGEYQLAPNFVFTVSVEDENLMVGITGQETHRIYARSETNWFYKVVAASITFSVNEEGECTSLLLHQNGIFQTAKKK